jgi:uncharacterized OsmC-like protein
MKTQQIADALHRVEAVLARRPGSGLQDDAPATARWTGGMRFIASHPQGMQVATDMPTELGGSGEQATPGWLFRAGLAACSATSILMVAAAEGVDLALLEVKAGSRSDNRGLFGMPGGGGEPVYCGPGDMALQVRIAAPGIAPDRLRALVTTGLQRSPVPNAVTHATALALTIDVSGS